MFSPKEYTTIRRLFCFFEEHKDAKVLVEFEKQKPFMATMDMIYETDNDLEIDDKGYEEFYAILLKRLDNGKYEELTYLHFPMRITYNGEFIAGTEAPDAIQGVQK